MLLFLLLVLVLRDEGHGLGGQQDQDDPGSQVPDIGSKVQRKAHGDSRVSFAILAPATLNPPKGFLGFSRPLPGLMVQLGNS